MKILGIILIIIVAGIAFGIRTYNRFVQSKEMVQNAMGQIAAQVESRWDALTSLIQATKNYQAHERETLVEVVQSRQGLTRQAKVKEVSQDDALFEKALSNVQLLVERYPELKADNLYKKTMESMNTYENNVRQARMIFNDTVTKYNRSIKVFPNSLIAGMTGFHPEEYFEATSSKKDMPQW